MEDLPHRPMPPPAPIAVVSIELAGGAPVPLPPAAAAWRTGTAPVEVYLVWPGGRRLLAECAPEDTLFSAALPKEQALHVVSRGPTRLTRLGNDADMPDAAATWLNALAPNLPHPADEGKPAGTIGDQSQIEAAAESIIRAGQQAVAISVTNGSLRPNGCGRPAITGDTVLLAPGQGALVLSPLSARIASLGDSGIAGKLLGCVEQHLQDLPALFDETTARTETEELRRLGNLNEASQTTPANRIADAIAAAGAALGSAASAGSIDAAAGFGCVPAAARAAGLRARQISLAPDWFVVGEAPLIVRETENDDILCLTWDGGAYRRPGGRRISARDAGAFDQSAFEMSEPMPTSVRGVWSMAAWILLGNRRDGVAALCAAAALAALGSLIPLATAWLLSDIVPSGAAGLLVSVGIALLAAAFATAILSTGREFATTRIAGRGAVRLNNGLMDRLLRLPTSFFAGFSAGDLNQRLENVDQLRALAISVVMSASLTAILSVVYLAVMVLYDPVLAVIALALVLGYIVAVVVARFLQMDPIREAVALDGEIAGLVYETLEGVPKLRASAAEDRALGRWQAAYANERWASIRAGRVATHFAAFSGAYQTITLLVLYAGVSKLGGVEAPTGIFIGFLAAFGIFQSSIVGLSQQLLEVYAAQPLIERALPILQAHPEFERGGGDPGALRGEIEATGLAFAYGEGGTPVLNGLSFRVMPGQHMAIVGASGSGKSTVLRLLLGFERPLRGSLTYDGQDLAHLDLARVRTQIGVVLQSSKLFAGSILDNIRGAGSASLEECLAAADRAGLMPDLQGFAMGLHTPITEGAGTLSGGQRQRILIARALAMKPQILLFDEATSALDNVTQAVVARTLDEMRITRITIAHRLSTVRNADMICVLEGGRFAEVGTYQELMALDGSFARLAERQLADR